MNAMNVSIQSKAALCVTEALNATSVPRMPIFYQTESANVKATSIGKEISASSAAVTSARIGTPPPKPAKAVLITASAAPAATSVMSAQTTLNSTRARTLANAATATFSTGLRAKVRPVLLNLRTLPALCLGIAKLSSVAPVFTRHQRSEVQSRTMSPATSVPAETGTIAPSTKLATWSIPAPSNAKPPNHTTLTHVVVSALQAPRISIPAREAKVSTPKRAPASAVQGGFQTMSAHQAPKRILTIAHATPLRLALAKSLHFNVLRSTRSGTSRAALACVKPNQLIPRALTKV